MGTPLYAAPEIMNGANYDQKVDVYSYGLILMALAVEESLLDFISQRWCIAFGKKKAPTQPMRVIGKMVDGTWRPVTTDNPIAHAPPTINSLIIRCCDQDPDRRPSFDEILHELMGSSKNEIDNQTFNRTKQEKLSSKSISANGVKMKSDEDQGIEFHVLQSMEASATRRLEHIISLENPLRQSSGLTSATV